MGWFDTIKSPKLKNKKKESSSQVPEGLWKKCTECSEIIQSSKLEACLNVCPYCDKHFRISAKEKIQLLCDDGSFKSIGANLKTKDPFKFVDKMTYQERLKKALDKTGLHDGTLVGTAKIHGTEVSLAVMDFEYMGGSMGVVTGEKIAHAMDVAFERKIPCVVISCSGGARMQEGILSLMQLAKTSASRQRLRSAGVPYISVLTDPTTGGCAASFAMQGDVNLAEPKALIGFAGPRVIEQTMRQTLPDGFQRSEFLLQHGFVDRIVHRRELKNEISFFVKMFQK